MGLAGSPSLYHQAPNLVQIWKNEIYNVVMNFKTYGTLILFLLHWGFHSAVLVWFFFGYLCFLARTFTDHKTSGEGGEDGRGRGGGGCISLTPHYHFHPLHRHLDIRWAIIGERSPLHIASGRTRTGNLWLPSASR